MCIEKLIYLLVLVLVPTIAGNLSPCQTPQNQDGNCKPIEKCPSLNQAFHHSRRLEYVRRSECGFGKSVNVCCPLSPDFKINRTETRNFVGSELLPSFEECGRSIQNKIIGGKKAEVDEFPWMALLIYQDKYFGTQYFKCGGTLINHRYVLTAAHCIEDDLIAVRLGEYNTTCEFTNYKGKKCGPPAINVPIEEKIVFQSYDPNDKISYHDIALLRLSEKIDFSDMVKPICLPITTQDIFDTFKGKKMTIAGWGRTESGHSSSVKLKLKLPVTSCLSDSRLDFGQICAGGEIGKDSCPGDSGGPLMNLRLVNGTDAQWYAVGVLSLGRACGDTQRGFGIYTKISKYMYWIIDNMKP